MIYQETPTVKDVCAERLEETQTLPRVLATQAIENDVYPFRRDPKREKEIIIDV